MARAPSSKIEDQANNFWGEAARVKSNLVFACASTLSSFVGVAPGFGVRLMVSPCTRETSSKAGFYERIRYRPCRSWKDGSY